MGGGETLVFLTSTPALSVSVPAVHCGAQASTAKKIMCSVLQSHPSRRRGPRSKNASLFLLDASWGREEGGQETSFTPMCMVPRSRPRGFANCPGLCLLLVVLGSSSDSAQAPPVHQEKGVTDAALLRHDERYESEEVGRKLALRSGAQGASSWMGLKEKEGNP